MVVGYLTAVTTIRRCSSLAQSERRRNLHVLRTRPAVSQVRIFGDVYFTFFAGRRESGKVVVFLDIVKAAGNLRSRNAPARIQRSHAVCRSYSAFINGSIAQSISNVFLRQFGAYLRRALVLNVRKPDLRLCYFVRICRVSDVGRNARFNGVRFRQHRRRIRHVMLRPGKLRLECVHPTIAQVVDCPCFVLYLFQYAHFRTPLLRACLRSHLCPLFQISPPISPASRTGRKTSFLPLSRA